MENFWEKVNREVYDRGGKSFVTRMFDQYPNLSDSEYERMCDYLTRQAAMGDLTNVSSDEAYYLVAEYDIDLANEFLSKSSNMVYCAD